MAIATVQALNAYFEEMVGAYTQHSRCAVLNKPTDIKYSENGLNLMVREIKPATTRSYDQTAGWLSTTNSGAANWVSFTPQAERSVVIEADAREERQSRAVGMPSSFAGIASQTIRESIAPEADAIAFAAIFSKIPAANVMTTGAAGADITPTGILATLDMLKSKLISARFGGRAYLFLSTTAYANLNTAIRTIPGAAAFVTRKIERSAVTGLEQILMTYRANEIQRGFIGTEADRRLNELMQSASMLDVSIDVMSYSCFDIIPVPDDCFYSAIDLNDGETSGQEAGGFAPADDARVLHALVVPDGSAFAAVAYDNATILVPTSPDYGITPQELTAIQSAVLDTPFRIGGIALNPLADSFKCNVRIQLGADVLGPRAKTVFCIADAAA
jgi:hypothetical protein